MKFIIHPDDDSWIIEFGSSYCANVCYKQRNCVPYASDYCADKSDINVKSKTNKLKRKNTAGCEPGHVGYYPM